MLPTIEPSSQSNSPTKCVAEAKTTSKLAEPRSEGAKLSNMSEKVSEPRKINYFKPPAQSGKSIGDITTDTLRSLFPLSSKESLSSGGQLTLGGFLSSDSTKTSSSVIDLDWLLKQETKQEAKQEVQQEAKQEVQQEESLAKVDSDAILKKPKADASIQTESPPVADFSRVARHFAQASSGVTQLVQHLEIASLTDASTSVTDYINVLEKLAQDYIELVKMVYKRDLSVLSSV